MRRVCRWPHAHGADGVAAALAAGVETIEHVTFMTAAGIEQRPRLVAQLIQAQIPLVTTPGLVPGTTAVPAIAARMAALRDHISKLVEAGAYVVLATDAGISPGKPYDVLPYAVAQVVEAGVPAALVLHMATVGLRTSWGFAARPGACRPASRPTCSSSTATPGQTPAPSDVSSTFVAGDGLWPRRLRHTARSPSPTRP